MEAKYGKLQSSLRTAENRAMALAQQLADTKSQLVSTCDAMMSMLVL